ncbi:MAG: hypothetical protein KIT60_07855 [Burkholderiaceae bacterium]|nr:hypothetical protein [Burkholderiaceae bacterium]
MLQQVNDDRLHACAVPSVATPRSLCELLDARSVAKGHRYPLGVAHASSNKTEDVAAAKDAMSKPSFQDPGKTAIRQ